MVRFAACIFSRAQDGAMANIFRGGWQRGKSASSPTPRLVRHRHSHGPSALLPRGRRPISVAQHTHRCLSSVQLFGQSRPYLPAAAAGGEGGEDVSSARPTPAGFSGSIVRDTRPRPRRSHDVETSQLMAGSSPPAGPPRRPELVPTLAWFVFFYSTKKKGRGRRTCPGSNVRAGGERQRSAPELLQRLCCLAAARVGTAAGDRQSTSPASTAWSGNRRRH